jgi:hypothetical protein
VKKMDDTIPGTLEHNFAYHAPDEDKVLLHQEVRQNCEWLAKDFDNLLPVGREKSLAMTKLEEAMFWANAAVARSR